MRSREMKELPREGPEEVAFIGIGYHWGFQGWERGKGEEGEPLRPPPHFIHWETKGKAVGVVEERLVGEKTPLLPLLLLVEAVVPRAREEKGKGGAATAAAAALEVEGVEKEEGERCEDGACV